MENPFTSGDDGNDKTPLPPTVSLDNLANAPANESYKSEKGVGGVVDATASGLADIGQGVAQAVQQTGQLLNPTKNAGEKHWYDTMPIVRAGKGLYNLGSQAVDLGKQYAQQAPSLDELEQGLQHVPGQAAGQMIAGEVGGKAVEGAADFRTKGVTPTARTANAVRAGSAPTDAAVRVMPNDAIAHADEVNRAIAPTASDFRSREHIHAASGDLGEIAKRVDWDGARGGKVAPDMRPRAVLNATDAYMKEMFNNEVAPKIKAVGDSPVNITVSSKDGIEFMSKYAGDADVRAAAQRILADPSKATMTDAYTMARGVNAELHNFEKATPAERNLMRNQNPQINALEELDHATSKGINDTFASKGVPGIKLFERRYAALSNFRRELQMRVSQAEAERSTFNPVKAVGQALVKGKTGIASASSASLADLGPGGMGDMLEKGMKGLTKSGLKPMKDAQPPAPNMQMSAPSGSTGGTPQRPLSFMDNPNTNKSGPVAPGGQGVAPPAKPAPTPAPAKAAAAQAPEANYSPKLFGGKAPGFVKNDFTPTPKPETSGGTNVLSGEKPAATKSSLSSSEVIGKRTAKPRTGTGPFRPDEQGFDFSNPDKSAQIREGTEKTQGPMPRGERRAVPRTAEEQQSQALFGQARQQLEAERPGENHSFEDVQARADQIKAKAKPVTNNFSGQGNGSSAEASSRAASNRANNVKYVRLRANGSEAPISQYDVQAQDAQAQPGEQIIKRYADGREEIQSTGRGFVDRRKPAASEKPPASAKPGLLRRLSKEH